MKMKAERRESKTTHLGCAKACFLCLTLLLVLGAIGCGDGLTGGSVPPGNPGPTRLVGTVVDEEDPTLPLADAEVEILLDDGVRIVTKTDASGMFTVELPRNRRCTVRIRPSVEQASFYQERLESFLLDAEEIRLLIPLPRRPGATLPLIRQLRLHPEFVVLRVGERVRFELEVQPPLQRPLRPLWSVHGRIGILTPDGEFIATRPGHGIVRARVGPLVAEARVTVQ